VIALRFHVVGAHLYTCSNMSALQRMLPLDSATLVETKLLPFTKEWYIARSARDSLRMHHPVVDGTTRYDMCDFELVIQRSFLVFFVKSMVTTLVVVVGSLVTALFLHPEEQVGDRCSVLFIAFLILVYNMQTDLGLGALTQLLWVDIFNIIQSCMVVFALAESIVVHVLLKTQRDRMAIQIDKVLRVVIPALLYPSVTASTLLWGFEQRSLCPGSSLCGLGANDPLYREHANDSDITRLAAWVGVCGVICSVIVAILWIMLRFRNVAREQVFSVVGAVALAYRGSNITKEEEGLTESERMQRRAVEWSAAAERLFKAYDLDASGSIDFKELRGMVSALYPSAPANLLRTAMGKARDYRDADGELDLASFEDAIAEIMEFMAIRAKEGDKTAKPLSHKHHHHFIMKLNFWRGASLSDGLNRIGMNPDVVTAGFITDLRKVQKRTSRAKPMVHEYASIEDDTHAMVMSAAADDDADDADGKGRFASKSESFALDGAGFAGLRPSCAGGGATGGRAGMIAVGGAPAPVTGGGCAVVVKTMGGGWFVGKATGTALPPRLEETVRRASDGSTLASTLIAQLVSAGFMIAGQSCAPAEGGDKPPELMYTLVASGLHAVARDGSKCKEFVTGSEVREVDVEVTKEISMVSRRARDSGMAPRRESESDSVEVAARVSTRRPPEANAGSNDDDE